MTQSDPPGRPGGVRRLLGRIAASAAIALVIAGLAGTVYEARQAPHDLANYPPPGRMFYAGAVGFHVLCEGSGSPTILLEGGTPSNVLDWAPLMPELAAIGRVCAYDRPGQGWSLESPHARTPRNVAAEMRRMLASAGESGPFVLVGASIGAKYVRAYAQAYSETVAGVVFLDGRHEEFEDRSTERWRWFERFGVNTMSALLATAGKTGYARVVGLPGVSGSLSAAERRVQSILYTRPHAVRTFRSEVFDQRFGGVERATESLGDKPVLVLAAGRSMSMSGWLEGQQAMARLSSQGELRVLDGVGHAIQYDAPEEVVAAVRRVVSLVR